MVDSQWILWLFDMVLRWFHCDFTVFYLGVRVGWRGNSQMVFPNSPPIPQTSHSVDHHSSGVFQVRLQWVTAGHSHYIHTHAEHKSLMGYSGAFEFDPIGCVKSGAML